MKGIELSEKYFEEFGRPMLEKEFSDILPLIAAGIAGSGSECFGFDDEISRDHDFEPGFCIFIPGEETLDRKRAFELERAYSKLPKEFEGVRRPLVAPVGGSRHGVIRTADFYLSETGSGSGILSVEEWLHIPDSALAQATNGKVFFDNYGEFTGIRNYLLKMPSDILLKRLAGNILLAAQSGQYNFARCIARGEKGAAQLALTEFVTSVMKAAFLLSGRYMPYYKWSFRALAEIPGRQQLCEDLTLLLNTGNTDSETVALKTNLIESICASLADELRSRNLTSADGNELEKHAYSVNDKIGNVSVRNLHILSAT